MGKRGPKKKPKGKPPGQAGVPACPTWLGPDGKRWWKAITGHMDKLGTIAHHHREIIAMVCSAAEVYHACQRDVKKHGHFDTGSMGNRVISPAVKQANTAWNQITRGLAQLGLTPVSAGEVQKIAGDEDDPLKEFL